ncbi:MAG TPA: hypothetical protein VD969_22340 [Symbiobacteriaceae bacterium]|nr:hypothetical protein [Symbiobacteriaceae bacterium]
MENALRIVSLCPSNTEIAHALGLSHWLVGVDDSSDWPPGIWADIRRVAARLGVPKKGEEASLPIYLLFADCVRRYDANDRRILGIGRQPAQ